MRAVMVEATLLLRLACARARKSSCLFTHACACGSLCARKHAHAHTARYTSRVIHLMVM